jgi:hypothetical protein
MIKCLSDEERKHWAISVLEMSMYDEADDLASKYRYQAAKLYFDHLNAESLQRRKEELKKYSGTQVGRVPRSDFELSSIYAVYKNNGENISATARSLGMGRKEVRKALDEINGASSNNTTYIRDKDKIIESAKWYSKFFAEHGKSGIDLMISGLALENYKVVKEYFQSCGEEDKVINEKRENIIKNIERSMQHLKDSYFENRGK